MEHHAARTPVRAPLAPREVVTKLFVITRRERDTNDPRTPLDRYIARKLPRPISSHTTMSQSSTTRATASHRDGAYIESQ